MRPFLFLLSCALVLGAGCRADEPAKKTAGQPLEGCLDKEQMANATQPAGWTGEDEAVVPMGRRITPVGALVNVAYFPLAVEFSPGGEYAYVTHSGQWLMEVIDVATGKLVQTVPGVGGFRGLAVSSDGKSVFTGEAAHGTVSRSAWHLDEMRVDKVVDVDGVPTDLELTHAGDRLIVVSSANSVIWELDPETLEEKAQYVTKGVYPYAAVVSPDDQYALFSHVGNDDVTVVERASGEIVVKIPVGLNPMGMAVDTMRNRVYVTNTDSDTISVIDLDQLKVIRTVDVSHHVDQLPGGTPNEIAWSAAHDQVFVSFADFNRVEVYNPDTWRRIGAIPTAHYPTGVAVSPDGSRLGIASSKGWGGAFKLKKETCVVSLLSLPLDSRLEEWTTRADENVMRTTGFWGDTCPDPIPLPLRQDEEPVIEHVVMIVRENKTYDAVMGDFERGNGDSKLTVFGEFYTPNLHEIARQFVNLDNYYADSQESFQGHTWTTQADCNDFFEKLYPSDIAQVLLAGYDPSAIIAERTIFDHYFDHGVTFRNYGEFEGFTKDLFDLYKDFINVKFPYYNMAIKDVWKAAEFARELNLGIFPDFVYIALPNDHTAGGKVGFPTPASMVADNDEATGMVIDAISHSPYWDSTIVFVIEDDPQGYGGDHVHAHRSICVAASPWLRREYTSSIHYSIPALYHTIELLFRLPPMHKNTAWAPPMYDIFVQGGDDDPPDYTPYEHIPRQMTERFNEPDGRMAEESEMLDLSEPDAAPGMGYVIWRIMKGDEEPPPYAKWNDR